MRDRDVREAIRAQLEADHSDDKDTFIVEEMGIWSGSVRVDVAVINGELSGFELKSAKDTLTRLPQQSHLYNDVFDRMTIVTADNHLKGCLGMVPEWWGVTIATSHPSGGVGLTHWRKPLLNPSQNSLQIVRLLWKEEAMQVLDRHGLVKGLKSKPVHAAHNRIAEELPLEVIKNEVRSCLKSRENWLH